MKKKALTPKKLLENVFQRFLVALGVSSNILKIYQNWAAGKGKNRPPKN